MIYINSDKVKNIEFNSNNMAIVIDFDKTLTSGNSADSWDASGKILGDDFKFESTCLYKKYEPIERSYEIEYCKKEKAMNEWYSKCMGLYYKYDLTKEKIIKSIDTSNLIFRKGSKEFLQEMYLRNVPVILLSAGIGNVIERSLKKNNCYFNNIHIISNFVEFDDNGNMIKFDDTKMIHSLNKTLKNNLPKENEKIFKERKYKLLFGDLIEDKKMIGKEDLENTLSVCFINERTEDNIEVFNNNFDVVLTKEDSNFDVAKKIVFNNV